MNERIKELALESGFQITPWGNESLPCVHQEGPIDVELTRFAELIVRECKENFSKVWYEQGMDIRGAEIGKFLTRFDEHFGVEE